MRIRHIEIFYTVMQAGTVQGAADILHITQPAATRLLQQAERHVGVALFRRNKGRLVPTDEAIQLFPEVEKVFVGLEQVRRMAAGLATGHAAELRVLSVPSLAIERLPRALGVWRARQPGARLALHTLHSRQIAESIALREAHVGFAFEPSTHPDIVNLAIARGHMVCVGNDLPGAPLRLDDATGRPIIDLDVADPLGRLLHAAFRAQGVAPVATAVVHSYHSAIELAKQGFGWAYVDNYSAAHGLRDSGLSVARVEPEIVVTVYALRAGRMSSNAAIDTLIECVSNELRI